MVSPDGLLLVIPRSQGGQSPTSRDIFLAGHEYNSAIVMGRDLQPEQDQKANGFTALGWSPNRATMAIAKSTDTMKNVAAEFIEEILQAHLANAQSMHRASDQLDRKIHISDANYLNDGTAHNKISANTMNALVKSQAGPFLFPGGTIHNALLALTQYYGKVSQSEAKRWGNNSPSNITPSNNDSLSSNPDDFPQNGHQLLQFMHKSIDSSIQRSRRREQSIQEAERKLEQAEGALRNLKDDAKQKWMRVRSTEEEIQTLLEDKVRERNRLREQQRIQDEMQRQMAVSSMGVRLESQLTPEELWELVARASEDLSSFAPIGLPKPNLHGPIDKASSVEYSSPPPPTSSQRSSPSYSVRRESSDRSDHIIASLSFSDDIRDDLEVDMGLYQLRLAALQADELVQDAAGNLLNVLSTLDTNKRSARIAAETTLLSIGNMQASALKALVQMERNSLNERLAHLNRLEQVIANIDVRGDLNNYIEHDKRQIYGASTRLGYGDDGGQASALAVLNCHSDGVGLGVGVAGTAANYSSSTSRKQQVRSDDVESEPIFEGDEGIFLEREKIEEAVACLFSYDPRDRNSMHEEYDIPNNCDIPSRMDSPNLPISDEITTFLDLDQAVDFLIQVTRDTKNTNKARACRASTCYAINRQRGIRTQLKSMNEFDALCKVLDAILSGCDREAADVANAKMCMMLSQTFYYTVESGPDNGTRLYPKIRLCQHSLWNDDDFWTQALFQCVTDSLTNCGVMSNFEQLPSPQKTNVRTSDSSKLKWHDLSSDERSEAASQVHAVIFAQLLALAHSMVEFGCSVDFACAFVRRLSVRHQLPLSQRKFTVCL